MCNRSKNSQICQLFNKLPMSPLCFNTPRLKLKRKSLKIFKVFRKMSDIGAQFSQAEIVPNILPVAPQQKLNVFNVIELKNFSF